MKYKIYKRKDDQIIKESFKFTLEHSVKEVTIPFSFMQLALSSKMEYCVFINSRTLEKMREKKSIQPSTHIIDYFKTFNLTVS